MLPSCGYGKFSTAFQKASCQFHQLTSTLGTSLTKNARDRRRCTRTRTLYCPPAYSGTVQDWGLLRQNRVWNSKCRSNAQQNCCNSLYFQVKFKLLGRPRDHCYCWQNSLWLYSRPQFAFTRSHPVLLPTPLLFFLPAHSLTPSTSPVPLSVILVHLFFFSRLWALPHTALWAKISLPERTSHVLSPCICNNVEWEQSWPILLGVSCQVSPVLPPASLNNLTLSLFSICNFVPFFYFSVGLPFIYVKFAVLGLRDPAGRVQSCSSFSFLCL